MKRRDMIKLLAASAAGGLLGGGRETAVPAPSTQTYQGDDLTGWEIALGDALHACSPEPAVALTDIETIHSGTYSTLRTNIVPRTIMAHNIAFKRIINSTAFDYIHTASYEFRLPYIPQTDVNAATNGQTIEGGLFIWDGVTTDLDYGMAWQWVINPWSAESGMIKGWDGTKWHLDRPLPIDTNWHTVEMVIDFPCHTATLKIDGHEQMSMFTTTTKTDWGDEIAARLQAEAISVDPRTGCAIQATHVAEFRNWRWDWVYKPDCFKFFPTLVKGE